MPLPSSDEDVLTTTADPARLAPAVWACSDGLGFLPPSLAMNDEDDERGGVEFEVGTLFLIGAVVVVVVVDVPGEVGEEREEEVAVVGIEAVE